MLNSVKAVVKDNTIHFLEPVDTSNARNVIVTFMEEPVDYEMIHLIEAGGSFAFLEEEPELYSDKDLKTGKK